MSPERCDIDTLMRVVRADPTLRRADRIAFAAALLDDGYSARDVARVASIRKGLISGLRRSLGRPRPPQGAAATNVYQPDRYPAPRSLRVAVQSLRFAPPDGLSRAADRLRISECAAYAIWRAIQYGVAADVSTTVPSIYRCLHCEQRTPTHPCAHCGGAWLGGRAA